MSFKEKISFPKELTIGLFAVVLLLAPLVMFIIKSETRWLDAAEYIFVIFRWFTMRFFCDTISCTDFYYIR